ncbi:MAG TPA: agmatine deiminase family protein [Cyclobacteriaceae bacterium]|nr:agmatine deiminase family protein [Cyclobacteriaceae bacterium]
MRKLLILSLITLLVYSCKEKSDPTAFYLPAEWEEQEAVWMGWDGNWETGDTLHLIFRNIVQALHRHVPVEVWVSNDSLHQVMKEVLSGNDLDSSRIHIHQIPGRSLFWARDVAPIFVVNDKGERIAIDFQHTGYFRYKRISERLGFDSLTQIKLRASDMLMMRSDSLMAGFKNEKIHTSELYLEGGAIDSNGKGSALISKPFILRNKPENITDEDYLKNFEKELAEVLGIVNIIWLDKGLAEDDEFPTFYGKYMVGGTGGHVDEFARFINPNTVMLNWVNETEALANPIAAENHERMKINLHILEKARDQDGNKLNIVKAPMPGLFLRDFVVDSMRLPSASALNFFQQQGYTQGDTIPRVLTSTYLNFFISNKLVLFPSYIADGGNSANEEQFRLLLKSYFPEHRIIPIHSSYLNFNGGGIHCITRQLPARPSIK